MGFVQFESLEAANAVADALGMERPYRARLGEDDPTLEKFSTILSMSHSVAQVTGDKLTTAELLRQAGY